MSRLCLGLCLSLVVVSLGCGGKDVKKELPKTVPVTGKVTMDGKPLAMATIMFVPTGETKGVECIGNTDDEGTYKLTQAKGAEGAPPGKYKVVINRFVKADGSPVKLDGSEMPANVGAVESMHPRYSSVMDTQLTADVPAAGGTIDFPLKKGR